MDTLDKEAADIVREVVEPALAKARDQGWHEGYGDGWKGHRQQTVNFIDRRIGEGASLARIITDLREAML